MKINKTTIQNNHPLFYGMTLIRPSGRKTKVFTLKELNAKALEALYVEQGLSAKKIAKFWSINENTLKAYIAKSNIRKRKNKH